MDGPSRESRPGGGGNPNSKNVSSGDLNTTKGRSTQPSWRDLIKVHPAADAFPMMSAEELAGLVTDIGNNGVRRPIVLLRQPGDGSYQVLDGRNRLEAAALAGLNLFNPDGSPIWRHFETVGADSGFDPAAFVTSANVHRRHLNAEMKREVIRRLLAKSPERSDNATAKIAQVSDKTVASVRRDMTQRSEIPNVTTRIDTNGRAQSAQKPGDRNPPCKKARVSALRKDAFEDPKSPPQPSNLPGPDPVPEKLREQFAEAAAIFYVAKSIQANPGAVKKLPLARRLALARGCLAALDVSLDDLRQIGGA